MCICITESFFKKEKKVCVKYACLGASLVAQLVKNPLAVKELLLLLSRLSRIRLCAIP